MEASHSVFYPLITGKENPLLRQKSAPVTDFNREIQDFSDILLELMYAYDGVGLSAPQLGELIRVIAVTHWKQPPGSKQKARIIGEYVMINPEIIQHSEKKQINEEACLSLPKIFGKVERYDWIKVRYFDPKGNLHIKRIQGFSAVVVQHEIDHLDGILFTDKILDSRF